ncbi:hypothetical protein GMRT_14929 [Giardia muris]|uniref:Uncharacterized protein n=1 Tax=Giardia muris TaxID=5742 RepID=A0A4Z1T5D5_GIAMU|nr:hypothetical protein GMRT_14929 [Giardia muris]|eukprot:TNJ27729.1 hypothetical protein GMRT_14929 [Giardia muris]
MHGLHELLKGDGRPRLADTFLEQWRTPASDTLINPADDEVIPEVRSAATAILTSLGISRPQPPPKKKVLSQDWKNSIQSSRPKSSEVTLAEQRVQRGRREEYVQQVREEILARERAEAERLAHERELARIREEARLREELAQEAARREAAELLKRQRLEMLEANGDIFERARDTKRKVIIFGAWRSQTLVYARLWAQASLVAERSLLRRVFHAIHASLLQARHARQEAADALKAELLERRMARAETYHMTRVLQYSFRALHRESILRREKRVLEERERSRQARIDAFLTRLEAKQLEVQEEMVVTTDELQEEQRAPMQSQEIMVETVSEDPSVFLEEVEKKEEAPMETPKEQRDDQPRRTLKKVQYIDFQKRSEERRQEKLRLLEAKKAQEQLNEELRRERLKAQKERLAFAATQHKELLKKVSFSGLRRKYESLLTFAMIADQHVLTTAIRKVYDAWRRVFMQKLQALKEAFLSGETRLIQALDRIHLHRVLRKWRDMTLQEQRTRLQLGGVISKLPLRRYLLVWRRALEDRENWQIHEAKHLRKAVLYRATLSTWKDFVIWTRERRQAEQRVDALYGELRAEVADAWEATIDRILTESFEPAYHRMLPINKAPNELFGLGELDRLADMALARYAQGEFSYETRSMPLKETKPEYELSRDKEQEVPDYTNTYDFTGDEELQHLFEVLRLAAK